MALQYGSPKDTIRAFGFRSKAGVGARSVDGDDLARISASAYATFGVLRGRGDEMLVSQSSGLTIEVGTGTAIVGTIDHPHFVHIDQGESGTDTTTLTVAAGGAAARVDTVAIRVQDDASFSQADVVILQGTRATAVTQTDTDFYFPLAEINVGVSASSIVDRDITPISNRFASPPAAEAVGLDQIQTLLLRTRFTRADVIGLMANDRLYTRNATKIWVLTNTGGTITLHEFVNRAGNWAVDSAAARTFTGVGSRPLLLPYYNSRDEELLAIVVGFSPAASATGADSAVAATPVIKAHILEAASQTRVTTGSGEITGTWSGTDNTIPFIQGLGVQSNNGTSYWVAGTSSRRDLASFANLSRTPSTYAKSPLVQYSIIASGADVIIREVGVRLGTTAPGEINASEVWTTPVIAPSSDDDAILVAYAAGHNPGGGRQDDGFAFTDQTPVIRKRSGATGAVESGSATVDLPVFQGGATLGPYTYDGAAFDNANAFYSPTTFTRIAGLLCWLGFANGSVYTEVLTGIEAVADFYPFKGRGQ